jgi:molybdopterin-guanine dinucleotide biosynthesis protein A
MRWVEANVPQSRFIATAAADTPFFPGDLVSRFITATELREDCIAIACSAGIRHPVFGLWPVALAGDLDHFLTSGEDGKVARFIARHHVIDVEFPIDDFGGQAIDPFFNINTPEDFEMAARLMAHAETT